MPALPKNVLFVPGPQACRGKRDAMQPQQPGGTERVFGPGQAAMLAATLPASTAAQDQHRQKRAAALRAKLAKIDVSERALVQARVSS